MSDQGYGGPPPWGEPVGDPQYRSEPYDAPPHYDWQPSDPAAAGPPPGHSGRTLVFVVLAIAVVAALGIGAFVLLSGDDTTTPAAVRSTAPPTAGSLPVAPVPLPSISLPTISLPTIALPTFPSFPVSPPGGAGLLNPCAFASTPTSVAAIYVGLAEVGQSTTAQGCVYRDTVPASVTAGLAAGGGGAGPIYVPGRVSGSVVEFTTADGSHHLQVSVTREPDGKLYVTKVRKN